MFGKSVGLALGGALAAAFLCVAPSATQAGGSMPAVGTPWAGMGGSMPAVGTPWAGMGGSMPAVGLPYGAFGGSMPAVGLPFGAFGGNIPAVGLPYGAFGGNIPAVGTPYGAFGGNIPAVGLPYGAFGGSMPAVGTPWGAMGGSMPAVGMPFSALSFPFGGTLGGSMPAVGVPGWGMPTMPGDGSGGMVVWIPAVIGGPVGPAPGVAPTGSPGAAQPVLCALDASNPAVSVPAGQKIVVIADTEMACQAINGTIANPATASTSAP